MTGLLGSPRATMRAICDQAGWRLIDQPDGRLVLDYGRTQTPPLTVEELVEIIGPLVQADAWLRRIGRTWR